VNQIIQLYLYGNFLKLASYYCSCGHSLELWSLIGSVTRSIRNFSVPMRPVTWQTTYLRQTHLRTLVMARDWPRNQIGCNTRAHWYL